MGNAKFYLIRACAGCAILFALTILALPAQPADPIFPPGSRIGLVPPAGMVASDTFAGFADPSKNAAILILALPAAAYPQIEKALDAEALKKQGISLQKREPIQLKIGKGFLLTGRQVADKERYRKWLLVMPADDLTALVTVQVPEQDSSYPDRVVRAALTTLAVRPTVPDAEELGLLPFAVGDLAGFHIETVLRGRALVLGDAPKENSADASKDDRSKEAPRQGLDARLLVAAVPGGPSDPDKYADFARSAFNDIGGIMDVHVTMSEPLRINGQMGYQTMAEAKDARTGIDVMVVQWLRFGGSGFLQMTGIAPVENWTSVLARLRAVRDSVEPK